LVKSPFLDDDERAAFLDNLGRACQRFDWRVWAWCHMINHYHLPIETLQPALPMRISEVNGVYTQAFSRWKIRTLRIVAGQHRSDNPAGLRAAGLSWIRVVANPLLRPAQIRFAAMKGRAVADSLG